MRRHVIMVLWLATVLTWASAPVAHAYLDPATTSYLIQIVAALVISTSVGIGVFFSRIQTFFVTAVPRMKAWWKHRRSPRGTTAHGMTDPAVKPLDADLAASISAMLGERAFPGAVSAPPAQTVRLKLFADDRTWLRRLPLAALAAFGIILPVLGTGTIEMYIANSNDLPFPLRDMVTGALLTSLIGSTVLATLTAVLRGRVFDLVLSLLVGVGLASWVQSLFLNIKVGSFMGNQFPWNQHLRATLVDLVIWIVLIALPLAVRYVSRKTWRWVVIMVPAVIMTAGAVAAGVAVARYSGSGSHDTRYLSMEGIHEVSSTSNIIVFLVDATDVRVIESMKEDPYFSFDPLRGFTSFDQTVALYQETFPTLTYMFTGQKYSWDESQESYFDRAYSTPWLFSELKQRGYKINLYSQADGLYSSPSQLSQWVDNMTPSGARVNYKTMMTNMGRLSAFGRSPLALQPSLAMNPDAFNSVLQASAGLAPPYKINDALLYQEILDNPLTVGGAQPQFSFIDMIGAHNPAVLTADARSIPGLTTDERQQVEGDFHIIYTYLDQLRSLGLYDSSTIIIMADHGLHVEHTIRTLSAPLLPCLFIKPVNAPDAPLQYSDAPTYMSNFVPTIVQAAGGDPAPFGQTYFQVTPIDNPVRRYYWIRHAILDLPAEVIVYDIIGNARDLKNWHQVGIIYT